MKQYIRIMLGRKSIYADQCIREGFIGCDFDIYEDLTSKLPENWKEFNRKYIPVYLKANPEKGKVSAGLACGALYTIAKGIQIGDIVLSPNGFGGYAIGEVTENYWYEPGAILPHRRKVHWYQRVIDRREMSQELRNSSGSIGTVSDVSRYAPEIESFLVGSKLPTLYSTDETVEDPNVFALEKHLEDFLVANWTQTELGKEYDIFEDEGEPVGQQYRVDSGNIDILAISKDKKELLVVELKKGRASDSVVGQIQRYMGFVLQELAEENQTVKGIIIALEDDPKIKRALAVTQNIEFYRYQIQFKLLKS
ncbi:endonuclease NucS domain-containing protein [Leptospira sp. WS58.C1]|nr:MULTISPECIES: endonuclease NucS domain-containing protein [unclassified Leptospira]EMJ97283.1 PF01939 domain protein [Leptospira sp. B5-022]MCR1792952.1 endonuclease NucS [Leptospira sp. id769339]